MDSPITRDTVVKGRRIARGLGSPSEEYRVILISLGAVKRPSSWHGRAGKPAGRVPPYTPLGNEVIHNLGNALRMGMPLLSHVGSRGGLLAS